MFKYAGKKKVQMVTVGCCHFDSNGNDNCEGIMLSCNRIIVSFLKLIPYGLNHWLHAAEAKKKRLLSINLYNTKSRILVFLKH